MMLEIVRGKGFQNARRSEMARGKSVRAVMKREKGVQTFVWTSELVPMVPRWEVFVIHDSLISKFGKKFPTVVAPAICQGVGAIVVNFQ